PPAAPKPDNTSARQPAAPVVLDGGAVSAEGQGGGVAAEKSAGPADAAGTGGAKRETSEAVTVTSDAAVTAPAPAPPPAKAAPAEVAAEPKKAARDEELARAKAPDDSYTYHDRAQRAEQQNRAANQQRNSQQVQMPDGGSQRGDSRAMNNRGNVVGESAPPASRAQRSAPAGTRGRSDDDRKERASAAEADETVRVENETRSAAGRRFRREGSAWVDVEYKPSMKMTGVRRGTDGYRALVADIPELGRIAEQLGGEVIAVVKGRAYRIR
ncbi:MAG TPA: hypothetical protein VE360_16330, partial [Pyrinomonadaceae bacterium]|nr:hypothetical protein [Pyrinomonadaceae bacterium]